MVRLLVAVVVALGSVLWIASAEAAPQISSVTPSSGPTAGGTIITISGAGFGAAGNAVSVGAAACPVTLESTNLIECTLPEGSGASRPIRVVGGGQASPPFPFAYAAPSVTNVTASSFPTAGGVIITISGDNFGPQGAAGLVALRSGVFRECSGIATEVEHSKLTCTLPPGEGHDVPVEVYVDGQVSPPGSLSYDPPAITAVTPTRGSSAGNTIITIIGSNFGRDAAVTVGSASCPVETQTDSSVECMLPPASGGTSDLQLSVGGQSTSVPFTYGSVASKCDAAKFKAAASYAQCLANADAKGAKKGADADPSGIGKCDDKFSGACAKAESKLTDCSQTGTCDAMAAATKHPRGWDGTIKGYTQ